MGRAFNGVRSGRPHRARSIRSRIPATTGGILGRSKLGDSVDVSCSAIPIRVQPAGQRLGALEVRETREGMQSFAGSVC